MKKVFNVMETVINTPYTKMFLGILLLYSSINTMINDYSSSVKGISIHHSIALYGLVMFLQSLISVLQALDKLKQVKEDLVDKKD